MRSLAWLFVAACQTTSPQPAPMPTPTPTPTPLPTPKPDSDCARVAEFFASYELGNYAEPEDREPVVAKYNASCEAAKVTHEQATCVADERDKWHAAQCVPAMMPELAAKDPKCKAIVDHFKDMPREGDEYSKFVVKRTVAAMWESCELDVWSPEFKTCMQALPNPQGYYDCVSKFDSGGKLAARISKMMQAWPR